MAAATSSCLYGHNRSATRRVVHGVLLATTVVVALLIIRRSVAHDRRSAPDGALHEDILAGLPMPEHDPRLDLKARHRLLFGATPVFTTRPNASSIATPDTGLSAAGPSDTPDQHHQHHHHQHGALSPRMESPDPSFSRMIILPDLHGDARQALRALLLAGLVAEATRGAGAVVPSAIGGARHGETGGGADGGATGAEGKMTAAAATAAGAAVEADIDYVRRRPPFWDVEWRWVGGDALLVQLGDVVDRGPDSLELLGRLERLRVQARAAGGDVVALLGNHELMNIHHDFRYVSRTELRTLVAAGGLPPLWPDAAAGAAADRETQAPAAGEGASGRGGETTAHTAAGLHLQQHAGATGGMHREPLQRAGDITQGAAGDAAGALPKGPGEAEEEEAEGAEKEEQSLLAESSSKGPHSARASADRELLHNDGNPLHRVRAAADVLLLPNTAAGNDPRSPGRALQGATAATAARSGSGNDSSGRSRGRSRGGSREGRGLMAPGSHRQGTYQSYQQQQEQVARGLGMWQAALAPHRPLGDLVRRRPLVALVEGGGCRVLVVHAAVLPWMLEAVDRVLLGNNHNSSSSWGHERGGGWGPRLLQPEEYVAAWNAVVAAALRDCDGRHCVEAGGGRGRGGGSGEGTDGAAGGGAQGDDYRAARARLAELLLGGDGAVWSRWYDSGPPREVCAGVEEVVSRLGVQRVVVGHTVQPGGRVSNRCGGQLVMADVGLSRAIAGELAVLECSRAATGGGELRALYGVGQVERL